MRYALRSMRKSPGFTLVAVLTLALGIGANTAIFSVVNALLLRPLPLAEPGRLAFLVGVSEASGTQGFPFSYTAYENLRDGSRSFTGVTAFCREGLTLTGAGEPMQVDSALVSPNFFEVLEAAPLLGRTFERSEGEAGGRPVVLISYRLWQSRFGSDPAIVGKAITLGQEVYTVIGVMPAEFPFPAATTEVWASRLMNYNRLQPDQIRHGAGYLTAIARLKPGVTMAAAQAEVLVLDRQYRREHPTNPDAGPQSHLSVSPLQETLVSGIRTRLWVLAGAVGLVLLIACANVAGLILARATGRAREIAVRAALGAGRSTLLRQLLTESLIVSMAGGIVGVLLAVWGVPLLARSSAGNLPSFRPVQVDMQVLVFTFAVTLLTGIVFGLAPAFQVSRPDLNLVLRDGGWGSTGGAGKGRMRILLAGAQMALSMVLLVGAGLLFQSFRQLVSVNPGFDPHHTLSMSVSMPPARYPDDGRRARFIRNAVLDLGSMPGVTSSAATLALPLNIGVMAPFLAEGQPQLPLTKRELGVWNAVTPGYFKTMGMALERGRDFDWSDDENAPPKIIINQALARRFWPDGTDPIGRHITYARRQVVAEIVGIVADVRTRGLDAGADLTYYTPYAQIAWANMTLVVRTAGDPHSAASAARARIHALDSDLPVVGVRTVDEMVDSTLDDRRQTMYLIAGFATVALLLAVVGLYGVIAYSVAQRTAEIGIRQAMGAARADILWMVLGQGLRLGAGGIAVGAAAAAGLTRLIAGMLYHVSPVDPVVFGVIATMFLVVALAASAVPAWRAARVDPLEALRYR